MLQIKRSKTEEKLITACRQGDTKAQREIYDKYSSLMFSVCRRYVEQIDAAEDILIYGFTKTFQKIDQFKGEGSFEG